MEHTILMDCCVPHCPSLFLVPPFGCLLIPYERFENIFVSFPPVFEHLSWVFDYGVGIIDNI